MADHTFIEWADSTFNPWIGCTKVGPGCDHCYAEADFDLRKHRAKWGPGNPRSRTSATNWKKPLQWQKQHVEFQGVHGRRRRVFCASLADVFDNDVPRQWRQDLFDLILATPDLDWLLLTKRIGNVRKMLNEIAVCRGALLTSNDEYRLQKNIWIGATICNQEEADRNIPKLLATPAAVRFVSMEPLLGMVDLSSYLRPKFRPSEDPDWQDLHGPLDWVVAGGESGTNARPMHPEWAASLHNQCAAAGVPYLFKQWGEWMPEANLTHAQRMKDAGHFENLYVRLDGTTHWIVPDDHAQYEASDELIVKVGKKLAGRMLDGKLHDGYPVTP